MNRCFLLYFIATILLSACGGSRQNPADLQHKIDSVVALDNVERLRLQGIRLQEKNPMKAFYDSLTLQPLPVMCTEDYVTTLPRYVSIPDYLKGVLEIQDGQNPLAISLPESIGARLMMVAVDNSLGDYSLWLYSLDDNYVPVDKLLICSSPIMAGVDGTQLSDCIISRDYEIVVRTFDGTKRKTEQKVYQVGDGRTFILKK